MTTDDKKKDGTLPIGPRELQWLDETLGISGATKDLMPSFTLRAYKAGTRILREGEKGGEMYVLYKGSLRVLRKRLLFGQREVATLLPGDFFGEVGFLVGAPRSATVETAEEAQVFSWNATDMQRVLRMNDEIGRKLENTARERIAKLSGAE
jgi:CRP-like cAMP-binding protein